MSRKCVFWRRPDGTPSTEIDGRYAPVHLLAEIGRTATLNSDGAVTWPGFGVIRLRTAFRSAVVITDSDDQEITEEDARPIISSTISALIKKLGGGKPLLHSDFIREANGQASKYLATKNKHYVLITSLSIGGLPRRRIATAGCELFSLDNRDRYPLPDTLKLELRHSQTPQRQCAYCLVGVKTGGRSHHDALAGGLKAVSIVRALWNLFGTYGSWRRSFGVHPKTPIAVVRTGRFHTVHHPNGDSVEDLFWYEPDFVPEEKWFSPKQGWTKLEEQRCWALRRINKHKFKAELEHLLVRYVEALDQPDMNVALLQMWAILEKLTNTDARSYGDIIERATWGFTNREVWQDVLASIRCRRNRYVHAAKTDGDRDDVAYLIKSVVDEHLLRGIRNDLKVESLKEYAEYLALPSNDTLRRRCRQYERAIRILKPLISGRVAGSER